MASTAAPTATSTVASTGALQGLSLTRRDRALLAAVAAGRCHLSCGPLPNLLVDRRVVCDQLAAHRLLISGLIRPRTPRNGELVPAELTPAGEAAARRWGDERSSRG